MSHRAVRGLLVLGWLDLISGFIFYLAMLGWALDQDRLRPFAIGSLYFAIALVVDFCVLGSLKELYRHNRETVEEILREFTLGAAVVLVVSGFVLARYYG